MAKKKAACKRATKKPKLAKRGRPQAFKTARTSKKFGEGQGAKAEDTGT
jgi:hypothetical protein